MVLFALIKTLLLWAIGWKVGSYIGRRGDKRKWVFVKDITAEGGINFESGCQFKVPKGETIKYFMIDHPKSIGNFTDDPKKAALARVLGKDVFVFLFNRDEHRTVLSTASASHPENAFNFLKQKFVNPVPPKDLHVQVL
jgi:hypothetical protein